MKCVPENSASRYIFFSGFITKYRKRKRIKCSFEVRIFLHCYFSLHIFKVQVPFEDIALKLLRTNLRTFVPNLSGDDRSLYCTHGLHILDC